MTIIKRLLAGTSAAALLLSSCLKNTFITIAESKSNEETVFTVNIPESWTNTCKDWIISSDDVKVFYKVKSTLSEYENWEDCSYENAREWNKKVDLYETGAEGDVIKFWAIKDGSVFDERECVFYYDKTQPDEFKIKKEFDDRRLYVLKSEGNVIDTCSGIKKVCYSLKKGLYSEEDLNDESVKDLEYKYENYNGSFSLSCPPEMNDKEIYFYVVDNAGNVRSTSVSFDDYLSVRGIDDSKWVSDENGRKNWKVSSVNNSPVYYKIADKDLGTNWGEYSKKNEWKNDTIVPEGDKYIHFWTFVKEGEDDKAVEVTRHYKYDNTKPKFKAKANIVTVDGNKIFRISSEELSDNCSGISYVSVTIYDINGGASITKKLAEELERDENNNVVGFTYDITESVFNKQLSVVAYDKADNKTESYNSNIYFDNSTPKIVEGSVKITSKNGDELKHYTFGSEQLETKHTSAFANNEAYLKLKVWDNDLKSIIVKVDDKAELELGLDNKTISATEKNLTNEKEYDVSIKMEQLKSILSENVPHSINILANDHSNNRSKKAILKLNSKDEYTVVYDHDTNGKDVVIKSNSSIKAVTDKNGKNYIGNNYIDNSIEFLINDDVGLKNYSVDINSSVVKSTDLSAGKKTTCTYTTIIEKSNTKTTKTETSILSEEYSLPITETKYTFAVKDYEKYFSNDGEYKINVSAYDLAGNHRDGYYTFIKDTKPPIIESCVYTYEKSMIGYLTFGIFGNENYKISVKVKDEDISNGISGVGVGSVVLTWNAKEYQGVYNKETGMYDFAELPVGEKGVPLFTVKDKLGNYSIYFITGADERKVVFDNTSDKIANLETSKGKHDLQLMLEDTAPESSVKPSTEFKPVEGETDELKIFERDMEDGHTETWLPNDFEYQVFAQDVDSGLNYIKIYQKKLNVEPNGKLTNIEPDENKPKEDEGEKFGNDDTNVSGNKPEDGNDNQNVSENKPEDWKFGNDDLNGAENKSEDGKLSNDDSNGVENKPEDGKSDNDENKSEDEKKAKFTKEYLRAEQTKYGEIDFRDAAFRDKASYSFDITEEGDYELFTYAVDNAMNSNEFAEKPEQFCRVHLDKTKPKITRFTFNNESDLGDVVERTTYGFFFRDDATVRIYVDDEGVFSGDVIEQSALPSPLSFLDQFINPEQSSKAVKKSSSGLDNVVLHLKDLNGEWQKYEQPFAEFKEDEVTHQKYAVFTIKKGFKGQVAAIVSDNVGHSSGLINANGNIIEDDVIHSNTSSIDIEENDTTRNYDANGVPLYNKSIPLTVTVEDTFSGIGTINWSIANDDESGVIQVDLDGAINILSGDIAIIEDSIEREQNLVTKIQFALEVNSNTNGNVVNVTLTDRSGNVSGCDKVYSIDTSEPVISANMNGGDPINGYYYNTSQNIIVSIKERNFNPSDVVVRINNEERKINWNDNGPSVTTDDTEHTGSFTFSNDGEYDFSISYTDMAGNSGSTYSQSRIIIDRTSPKITNNFESFGKLDDEEIYYNIATKEKAKAEITVVEKNFSNEDMHIAVLYKSAGSKHTDTDWSNYYYVSEWKSDGDKHTLIIPFTEDGVYKISMSPVDRAGNQGDFSRGEKGQYPAKTAIFETDYTVPVIVSRNDHSVEANNTKFFDLYNFERREETAPTVIFEDTNIDHIECDGQKYAPVYSKGRELGKVKPEDISSKSEQIVPDTYSPQMIYTLNDFTTDGVYSVKLKAYDKAGNSSELNDNTYVRMIDPTVKVLAYIENSNRERMEGWYSFEDENGPISKQPSSFSDLSIVVLSKLKSDTQICLVDKATGEIKDTKITNSADSLFDSEMYEMGAYRYKLPGEYFEKNYTADTETNLYLRVINNGESFDLGEMYIDNTDPNCSIPEHFHDWGWFKGSGSHTIVFNNVSEILDIENTVAYIDGKTVHLAGSEKAKSSVFKYDEKSSKLSLTLEPGGHKVGLLLVDRAGNTKSITEVQHLAIGNYRIWLVIGAVLLAALLIAAIVLIIKKVKRYR